jgi:CheY-like chemotaxis protein
LDKLFDRFYQAGTTYKKDSEGSGIGLALTKELVELHHGKIEVECTMAESPTSPFPKGSQSRTTFTILLPISINHFKQEEIVEISSREDEDEKKFPPIKVRPSAGQVGIRGVSPPVLQSAYSPGSVGTHDHETSDKSVPIVLIVEDNPDVTTYISSFLQTDFQILTAENGKEGWQKTVGKYPHLIISDVMMPEMDGFELCKKIKSDEQTSHIPVILLTAKADLESKIEGFEFGADDYINKPFEADELKVRSRNLIEQRQKLREKDDTVEVTIKS